MIHVIVYKDVKGLIEGFSLQGHAGYAEHGSDIVCSAVSMLTINTLNSISEFTSDAFTYQEDEQSGTMEFHMVVSGQQSQLLLKALLLGLDTVRSEYGKKYIDLKESQINKEV